MKKVDHGRITLNMTAQYDEIEMIKNFEIEQLKTGGMLITQGEDQFFFDNSIQVDQFIAGIRFVQDNMLRKANEEADRLFRASVPYVSEKELPEAMNTKTTVQEELDKD